MPPTAGPVPQTHPPRPRLTLRLGVTGHRYGASLEAAAIPRIERQLRQIFRQAAGAARAVGERDAAIFSAEAPNLVAVSCLAAGGDQLFAREAMAQGWRVEAVLPFAAQEYEADFEAPQAKAAYRDILSCAAAALEIADPRKGTDASEAYETAGLVMLDHADVVIAIWDGGESRGRGGTREIVDEALLRGTPVIWINTTRDCVPAVWDGKDAIPLPEFAAGGTSAPARFAAIVTGVLAPPQAGASPDEDVARLRLKRYLEETESDPPWWTSGYDAMLRLTARRPFRFPPHLAAIASRRGEWDGFIGDLPPAGNLPDELRDVLLTRFLWADHVADRAGRTYRGAYVLNFMLAALAVFVGLLVVFFWDSIAVKTACALLEFILIALILAVTRAGARGAWHARFLDARRLAEMLRHARIVAPFGRATAAGEAPGTDPGELWTAWYAQAARRELGLPQARIDAAYQQAVIAATVEHEVTPQLAYHRANYRRLHETHHALDRVGERLFYLTGVLCLVWVGLAILYWTAPLGQTLIKYVIKPLLTFLAAVLPAIGAALAGIRAQGDFQASAQRSRDTERELERITERLAQGHIDDYREACLHQLWVADAMASDLVSWRSLYSNRPLTIPG